jgi:Transposase
MDDIGIDVHKRESQMYILAEDGEIIERRIRTEDERFAAVLGDRPRARILIEASTDSEWVARCLEALGHEVIVADPNFAPMYATRTRKVKTDRRDARALAERIGNIRATAPPCGGLQGAPGIPGFPWLSAGYRAILIALPGDGALATGTSQGARERGGRLPWRPSPSLIDREPL